MKRTLRRISTTVYALGILSALTFGATQAFGQAVYLTCRYQPPTWLGACITPPPDPTAECTARCQTYDPNAFGRCDVPGSEGCCVCFY